MTNKGDKRERVNGKEFEKALNNCQTSEEIFELLGKTLGAESMKDGVKNMSNQPSIVNLLVKKAELRIKNNLDFPPQCCMDMAVAKYCKLTGGSVEKFKVKNNEYADGLSNSVHNDKQNSLSAADILKNKISEIKR